MNPDNQGGILLPPSSSTTADIVDPAFYLVFWVSVFFFCLITGLVIYFSIRYRRKGKPGLTSGVAHNTFLEVAWTAIPTLLMMVFFYIGFTGFMKLHIVPSNAVEVKVKAQRWFWSFDYAEGVSVQDTMVVPIGRPVRIVLSSQDVLHSFFVPEFRIKYDVLPNRYQVGWFEPKREGTYQLFCTEYCGTQHSSMLGQVVVTSEENYQQWLQDNASLGEGLTLVEYGTLLFSQKKCDTCHTNDGSALQGPSFLGVFGTTEQFTDGTSAVVDENYIRESILNPASKIVQGYPNVMTSYQGLLQERQIDALIEYIKSLR